MRKHYCTCGATVIGKRARKEHRARHLRRGEDCAYVSKPMHDDGVPVPSTLEDLDRIWRN